MVCFYRQKQDANSRDRLQNIVGRYRDSIFNHAGGEYWENLFCWPSKIVEWNSRLGIVCPAYQKHFFFQEGMFKGKEKEGKWFASAKLRNKFLTPAQKGTWLSHFHLLVKTTDLMQPCRNPACGAHWFVFDNTTRPRCPFCGTEYKGQLPVLNLYYSPSHGRYLPEDYRLMVYDKQSLYMWHADRFITPNERTRPEDRKPVGDFHFFNNRWILINRRLPDMWDVTGTSRRQVKTGEYVELTEGRKILLSGGNGGRLIVVQLIDN